MKKTKLKTQTIGNVTTEHLSKTKRRITTRRIKPQIPESMTIEVESNGPEVMTIGEILRTQPEFIPPTRLVAPAGFERNPNWQSIENARIHAAEMRSADMAQNSGSPKTKTRNAWQAFKSRFFPAWAKRAWPVETVKVPITK